MAKVCRNARCLEISSKNTKSYNIWASIEILIIEKNIIDHEKKQNFELKLLGEI